MDGEPRRSVGEDTELTLLSREELESAVQERTDVLGNVMNAMVDVLLKLDTDGRIQLANAAVESILGHDREAVVGKPIDALLAPQEELDEGFELVSADEFLVLLIEEGQVTDLEVGFLTAGGSVIPMSLSTAVMEDENGIEGFVCVAKDISERKDAERALRDRTLQFALLNQTLQHDIRNEMTVLLGSARRLDHRLDGEEGDLLGKVLERGENIVTLTNTVADLIEVLEEDGSPDLVPVELPPVLRRETEDVDRKYADASVRKEGDWPDVVVQANGMLQSVLQNLLSNAVEHNDTAAPEVTVTVRAVDDAVQVRIADNGPGVPDDRKDAIFRKGEQGLASSGSGLGLYLVSTVVSQYGGDVWVEDNEPEGAVFVLELPRFSW